MNNLYQYQGDGLPFSNFSYFPHYSTLSSCWQGTGEKISKFIKTTETKLSQWFWFFLSLIGKYILFPYYFEQRFDNLREITVGNVFYTNFIQYIRTSFRTERKIDLSTVITSLPIVIKNNDSIWQSSIATLVKFMWKNARKITILGLAVQLPIVQTLGVNVTNNGFMPEAKLSNKFPHVNALQLNQTTSMINKTVPILEELPAVNATATVETNSRDIKDHSFLKKETERVKKPRSVLTKSPKCSIQKNKLKEIVNATTSAITNSTATSNSNKCKLNSNKSDDCDELIKQLQCGIIHLENGYTKKESENRAKPTKWENDYNDLLKKYNKAIDDSKKLVIQENQQKLDSLQTTIQDLEDKLEKTSEELRAEQTKQFFSMQKVVKKAVSDKCFGFNSNGRRLQEIPSYRYNKSHTECSLSKIMLTELVNTITSVLSNTTAKQNRIYCVLNYIDLDNCGELIKQMQCGINNLENEYIKIIENGDKSTKWENAYHDLFKLYNKAIDDAKKSFRQEIKKKLDTLQTKIQELTVFLNSTLEKLKEVKQNNSVKMQRLVASEIGYGQIGCAVYHFKELKDDSKLSKIIEIAYNDYGRLCNVENIFQFIRALPHSFQDVIAHQALFSQMEHHNHLNSPQVFKFDFEIKKSIGYNTLAQDQKNQLICLKYRLEKHITRFITALARKCDYQKIKLYAEHSTEAASTINDYMPDFIQNIYANNSSNFQTTMKFIEVFSWLDHTCKGYDALFSEMRKNNHLDSVELIMLAYKVKGAISNTDTEEKKKCLQNLKDKLPSGIKALLWDSWVALVSRSYPGYTLYGSMFGNIYTYPDNFYEGGRNQKWIVSIVEENNSLYFQFKNQQNDLTFYANNEGNTKSSYYTYNTYNPKMLWQVIPIENGTYFCFKNKENGRILDAGYKSGRGTDPYAVISIFDCRIWASLQWKII